MEKIYLVLMHTNTIPSKFVRFFTGYKYSHVAIALNENCDTLYSFGRKKVNSIFGGGFIIQQKDGEFFQKFNKTICKICELKINVEQLKKIKKLLSDMKMNESKYSYDFIGIIPRFFGIPVVIKDKYVCSYFVADILEKANIYKFGKKTCLIRPRDFEKIKECNEIYSGYYKL